MIDTTQINKEIMNMVKNLLIPNIHRLRVEMMLFKPNKEYLKCHVEELNFYVWVCIAKRSFLIDPLKNVHPLSMVTYRSTLALLNTTLNQAIEVIAQARQIIRDERQP
jgi:hypothetical protein